MGLRAPEPLLKSVLPGTGPRPGLSPRSRWGSGNRRGRRSDPRAEALKLVIVAEPIGFTDVDPGLVLDAVRRRPKDVERLRIVPVDPLGALPSWRPGLPGHAANGYACAMAQRSVIESSTRSIRLLGSVTGCSFCSALLSSNSPAVS